MNLYIGRRKSICLTIVLLIFSSCICACFAQSTYRITRKSTAEIKKARDDAERSDSIFQLVASVKHKKLNVQIRSSYHREKTLHVNVNVFDLKEDTLMKKFTVWHNSFFGIFTCYSYDVRTNEMEVNPVNRMPKKYEVTFTTTDLGGELIRFVNCDMDDKNVSSLRLEVYLIEDIGAPFVKNSNVLSAIIHPSR